MCIEEAPEQAARGLQGEGGEGKAGKQRWGHVRGLGDKARKARQLVKVREPD